MLLWRVLPVLVFASMYMFSFIGVSFGWQLYGNCIRYAVGESKPVLTNGDRWCIRTRTYAYCKEFKCPITKCVQPVVPQNGGCPYCKGTCSYGGAIYPVFSKVPCLDEVNSCTCRPENIIRSTKIGTTPRGVCA